jgi:hypothetical protein
MSLCVLDTDHVTLFQRAHPVVVQRVAAVEPEALAVTVVTVEGILVTRNRRDFERVPDLVLQDWTVP